MQFEIGWCYNYTTFTFGDEKGLNQYFENNDKLNSELKILQYQYNDIGFSFYSDLGVFSKDHIDYGSKFLVETLLSNRNKFNSILDLGCGYGFIGIVLAKIFNSKLTMVDVNSRCVHLSEKNIKENTIDGTSLISDGYDKINAKFDLIVTNPPIRAGKEVVLDFLLNSKNYLLTNGELWFVIRKDQGAKTIIKAMSNDYNVELIKKSKGFYIFCAKTIDKS